MPATLTRRHMEPLEQAGSRYAELMRLAGLAGASSLIVQRISRECRRGAWRPVASSGWLRLAVAPALVLNGLGQPVVAEPVARPFLVGRCGGRAAHDAASQAGASGSGRLRMPVAVRGRPWACRAAARGISDPKARDFAKRTPCTSSRTARPAATARGQVMATTALPVWVPKGTPIRQPLEGPYGR